jgi:PmbA protein
VTNPDGGAASWSRGRWAIATSDGFRGAHAATSFSLSASVIAGEGSGMERGGEGRSMRHRQDLPSAEAVGAEAGRRAVARLGPRKLESRVAPVIVENRIATSLLGPLIGAVSAPAVARGVSFLKDRLEKPVFSEAVTLVDQPRRPRGLGSTPFDDEGVEARDFTLIEKGVLRAFLSNAASARQLGCPLTGHASRGLAGAPGVSTHNLTLLPGRDDLATLMAGAKDGLLVTSMFGPSLNANTGDWSAGVSGFWFEGGEIAFPVNEITIAGNLIDLYGRIVPGADLEFRGAANAPSLLIDAVTIAGR